MTPEMKAAIQQVGKELRAMSSEEFEAALKECNGIDPRCFDAPMNSPQGADGWAGGPCNVVDAEAKDYENLVANAEAYASHYTDARDYASWSMERGCWNAVRAGFIEGTRHERDSRAQALRAAHAEGVRAGREMEREECAKVADDTFKHYNSIEANGGVKFWRAEGGTAASYYVSQAIRARSARDWEGERG